MHRTFGVSEPWIRLVQGFTWGALAAATSAFASQRPQAGSSQLGVGEVRAAFARADVDGDGRLDRPQAVSGGIPLEQFARYDADADGKLDGEEYLVARQAVAARSGEATAADLGAESTRIQAAWRARRLPGPSTRVEAARRDATEVKPGAASIPPAGGSAGPAPSQPAEASKSAAAPAGATKGSADAPTSPGLGLSRLRQNTGSAQPQGEEGSSSLEARARSAQELILERRKQRGVPARAPVIVDPSRGTSSRASVAGSSATQRSPAPATTRMRTQQRPVVPQNDTARQPKPKRSGGN